MSTENLVINTYILAPHNVGLSRNTTFEEVFSEVNECLKTVFTDVLMVSITIKYQILTTYNMGDKGGKATKTQNRPRISQEFEVQYSNE